MISYALYCSYWRFDRIQTAKKPQAGAARAAGIDGRLEPRLSGLSGVQALLRPNPEIMQLLDQIAVGFPHPIRFGLGLGEIVTEINREQSIGADGPAYWRARAAINSVHEKNDYGSSRLAVSFGDKELSQAVNTVLAAASFIQSKWNTSQREVLERMLMEYIYDENFSHGEIAELLQISPSALSKRLKSSGLKIYLRNRRLAMRMILQAAKEAEE